MLLGQYGKGKGPENSVFLGGLLRQTLHLHNRGVGWAGGRLHMDECPKQIRSSALNIDMGVVPEAPRSWNCAEHGTMKYITYYIM